MYRKTRNTVLTLTAGLVSGAAPQGWCGGSFTPSAHHSIPCSGLRCLSSPLLALEAFLSPSVPILLFSLRAALPRNWFEIPVVVSASLSLCRLP